MANKRAKEEYKEIEDNSGSAAIIIVAIVLFLIIFIVPTKDKAGPGEILEVLLIGLPILLIIGAPVIIAVIIYLLSKPVKKVMVTKEVHKRAAKITKKHVNISKEDIISSSIKDDEYEDDNDDDDDNDE
jgi:cell division protein FtsL